MEFGGFLRAVCVRVIAIGITAVAAVTTVQATEISGCEESARELRHAAWNEAYGDYFAALGLARHLSDEMERDEALDDADVELAEALAEANDQYEARLELCDELEEDQYDPDIDPADFTLPVTNMYYPLTPGTMRVYEKDTEDGPEQVVVEVLSDTIEIAGVTCVVVRDREYLDGELAEDTYDYFAQHVDGSVWYFGEDTVEIEDDVVVSVEGAWKGGEDGAKPGIIMPASPQVGDAYRQEMALTEAEDAGRIFALDVSLTVPAGTFDGCVQTQDFTPIEPDALEDKYYAPGVGVVLEVDEEGGRLELLPAEAEAGIQWIRYP